MQGALDPRRADAFEMGGDREHARFVPGVTDDLKPDGHSRAIAADRGRGCGKAGEIRQEREAAERFDEARIRRRGDHRGP